MCLFRTCFMVAACVGLLATAPVSMAQMAKVDSLTDLLNTKFSNKGSGRIAVLVDLGEQLLRIDPDRSLMTSKEALRLSITLNYQDYISRIYNNTGTANRLKGNYSVSLSFHDKALENDRKKGNRAGEALSLNNIGNVFLVQGRYKDAILKYERSLSICQDISYQPGIAKALNNLGLVYKNQGDLDRALAYYQNAFRIFQQMGDKVGMANVLNNTGIVYRNQGNLKRSLENFVEALGVFQQLGNNVGQANTLNNIGNIYYQQEKYEEALGVYDDALNISRKLGDKNSMAGKLSNIGGVYLALGDKKKSLEYTRKALDVQREIGDDKGQISTLNNLGAYFKEENKLDKSLSYFEKAEKIEKRLGDHSYTAVTLSSIGEIHTLQNRPEKGLAYLNRAFQEAKKHGNADALLDVYASLSQAYADVGDYKKSYDFKKQAEKVQDSLNTAVSTHDLEQMQSKFETAQKQREIELLSKEKEVQDLRLNKEITVRNMVVAIFILALIMLGLIYGRYRANKKANQKLNLKNREIERQKQSMEEKNLEITSSIEYAKRIQDAIMPSLEEIGQVLSDCFVYYRPRGIVSGDFYWFAKTDEFTFVAAVDCTGHGVPGAFLSMIGNDHLNRIVKVEGMTMPDKILNRLHYEIQSTLRQKHGVTDNHDGMDIALCVIDFKQDRLLFSSANRYLYHIRDGVLNEIKGDHYNIGGIMHEDVRHYRLHELDLKKGDVLYIFSDGVSDQFGGPRSKKFGYARLKQNLIDIHGLPMEEQRNAFGKVMDQWMGDNDQIDDFLLIGIRV